MPKIRTLHPLGQGQGTDLTIAGHLYEFRFNDEGVCVADFDNAADYRACLGISEGYTPHGPGFDVVDEPPKVVRPAPIKIEDAKAAVAGRGVKA